MIHLWLAPRTVRAAQTARFLRAVLPPSDGGLHCGASVSSTCGPMAAGAPAVQRRAPLRPHRRRGTRPERAGRPAGHRRAPLRHGPDLDHRRAGLGHPAGHWQAPLRLFTQQVSPQQGRRAPAGHRWAPLRRHPRRPGFQDRDAAAPADRRAPLRLGDEIQMPVGVQLAFPPVHGGHHCGNATVGMGDMTTQVPREAKAGSIAVRTSTITGRSGRRVSARSVARSIAARTRYADPKCKSWCSHWSTTDSIVVAGSCSMPRS